MMKTKKNNETNTYRVFFIRKSGIKDSIGPFKKKSHATIFRNVWNKDYPGSWIEKVKEEEDE